MWIVVSEFWKYKFVLDFENMAPFHLAAKFGHLINKFSNGWFWLLNGVESKICRGLHFTTAYITEIDQYEANNSSLKTIKIALIPMIKTIMASNLPQNPQKTKLADLKCTSGKWLFYIFRYAQLQNILQKIRFAHLAKIFASNSLRSFGKRSHFTGPILQLSLRSTFAKLF